MKSQFRSSSSQLDASILTTENYYIADDHVDKSAQVHQAIRNWYPIQDCMQYATTLKFDVSLVAEEEIHDPQANHQAATPGS